MLVLGDNGRSRHAIELVGIKAQALGRIDEQRGGGVSGQQARGTFDLGQRIVGDRRWAGVFWWRAMIMWPAHSLRRAGARSLALDAMEREWRAQTTALRGVWCRRLECGVPLRELSMLRRGVGGVAREEEDEEGDEDEVVVVVMVVMQRVDVLSAGAGRGDQR